MEKLNQHKLLGMVDDHMLYKNRTEVISQDERSVHLPLSRGHCTHKHHMLAMTHTPTRNGKGEEDQMAK